MTRALTSITLECAKLLAFWPAARLCTKDRATAKSNRACGAADSIKPGVERNARTGKCQRSQPAQRPIAFTIEELSTATRAGFCFLDPEPGVPLQLCSTLGFMLSTAPQALVRAMTYSVCTHQGCSLESEFRC